MYKFFKFLIVGLLFSPFFFPAISQAAIIHSYVCADWSLQNSASCTSDAVTFTNANVQSAANNGAGNTLYDLSNTGAGQTVYVTATLTGGSGNVQYGCYGSVTNCSFANLVNGANSEVAMTVPTEPSAGNFAYLVFTNSSGAAQGTISSICVDNDGTSCAAASGGGGGGDTATSTVDKAIDVTYYGFIVYIAGFWGIIWFFRRR